MGDNSVISRTQWERLALWDGVSTLPWTLPSRHCACSVNAYCVMAPCVGPYFQFLTFWPISTGLNASEAASPSFGERRGWSVMENLQAPELRTDWFDMPVTGLTQAMVPRGWGGFPAEAGGKPRGWKSIRGFFQS